MHIDNASLMKSCASLDCLCVDSVAQEIAVCADCLVAEGGNVSEEQSAIDRESSQKELLHIKRLFFNTLLIPKFFVH